MGKETGKKYKAEAALTLHETPKSKLSDGDVIKRDKVRDVMMQYAAEGTESTMEDTLDKLDGVSSCLHCKHIPKDFHDTSKAKH